MSDTTMAKKPVVVIGIPTYDHLKVQTFLCYQSLDTSQVDVKLLTVQRVMIDRARSAMAEQALRLNADYLLFIDDDMTFEPDALNRLIARDKDIVGGLFFGRVEPSMQLVFTFEEDSDGNREYVKYDIDTLLEAEKQGACINADGIGTGFTLIKVAALHKFRRTHPDQPFFKTYSKGEKFMSEDIYFCALAQEAGCTIWCDTEVKVGHIGEKIWSFDDFTKNAEHYKRVIAAQKRRDAKKKKLPSPDAP